MAFSHNPATPVPFPQPDNIERTATNPDAPESPASPTTRRSRTSTNASTVSNRLRSASIKFIEAAPPPGMWAATGQVTSKAPTLSDIRRGSYSANGWHEETQKAHAERRASVASATPDSPLRPRLATRTSSGRLGAVEQFPAVEEEVSAVPSRNTATTEGIFHDPEWDRARKDVGVEHASAPSSASGEKHPEAVRARPQLKERVYSNGYIPPPKVPWTTSTAIGLKAFWKFFLTPSGFLITIYGLNVVAWGGMLFLLLCNASPAMCKPTCNDIQSPRRKWIEVDSQILNALFCVTGFGLAPWRARDVYWWAWWRLGGSKRKETGIRRLAGIHRGWFRLPGSDLLPADASAATVNPENPAVPIPVSMIPDAPPTGVHAPPSKGWKMDFVIWMNMSNTFFQIVLCFYMWHYNRYKRPSWATGCFVAMGCVVAGVAGIMMFHEGKYVKRVEGVPMPKPEGGLDDLEAQKMPAAAAKS